LGGPRQKENGGGTHCRPRPSLKPRQRIVGATSKLLPPFLSPSSSILLFHPLPNPSPLPLVALRAWCKYPPPPSSLT
jgi:hypothetical protein